MNEVDYSAFFYRPEQKPPEKENSNASSYGSFEEKRDFPVDQKGKKRGLGKKILLTSVVVLLLFCITLLCVDFFTNGSVLQYVFSAFRGSDYEYSFVVVECAKKDYAYAQSLLVKQSGGAGYVMTDGDVYFVAYGVWCDRASAEKVSAKNATTFVRNIGFSSKNVSFCNEVNGYLVDLNAIIEAFERGSSTEAEVSAGILRVAESVDKTSSYEDGGLSDAEKNLLVYLSSSLKNLDCSSGTKAAFLSDLRCVVCSVAYSFCRAVG